MNSSGDDGPIERRETPEELIAALVETFAASNFEAVVPPHRRDVQLVLLVVPRGPILQAIIAEESGWVFNTLRPVRHWLPYYEPGAEIGVFTEAEKDASDGWRPEVSDATTHAAVGAALLVCHWGVYRAAGLDRFRHLRHLR